MANFIKKLICRIINRISINIDIIFYGIKIEFGQDASIRTGMRYLLKKFKKKHISVLEIGTRHGESAKVILRTLNIKKYTVIDPFITYQDYKSDPANKLMTHGDKIYKKTKKELKPLCKNLIFLRGFSNNKKILKNIKKNSLDLVFVDGNHEYKYVLEDLRNYFPKIKKGGILMGDDFNHRSKKSDFLNKMPGNKKNKGVYEAVISFSKENKINFSTFGHQGGYPKLFLFKK
jgi:cephalosporin hydroxylase